MREQGILIAHLRKLEEKLIEFLFLSIVVVEVVQYRTCNGLMQKLQRNITEKQMI